jgi:pyrroloquinoline quinone (PQQ) biosynthesis protein C
MGVDFVQGFHVGRPTLWAQNVEFLAMTQEEMLDPTFQRVRDLKDIANYPAWLSTRRKAMRWLSLHAHYDDAHPWEAPETVARLLGNAPGVDEVHAVKRSIEMSYAYLKVSLDCCL